MTPPEIAGLDDDPSAAQDPGVIYLPHLPPPPEPTAAEPRTPRRGRHFGPRPVADPRSARLDIRCTPAVRAKAEAAATAAGISVAGYVAALINGQPGPRAHRNPSEATKMLAQLRGEMGKRGSNLNQGARALNEISILAGEGSGHDRLAELVEEMVALHRQAIGEHRECVAAIMRALGLRPDADHY